MGVGGLRGWRRSLSLSPRMLAYTARTYGVTEVHLLKIIRARKKFRAARRDRARKVGAFGSKTYHRGRPPAERRREDRLRAGEGELHGWLRRLNLTGAEFSQLVGMSEATFNTWFGFCMWAWPVRFLALYAYARNMEKFLVSKGYDVESFRDTPITEMFHQHYRIGKPSSLILEGITPEERARIRHELAKARGNARWHGHKSPNYDPWK